MTELDILKDYVKKECKTVLDRISLNDINKDLKSIVEDDYGMVSWIKLYEDYHTGNTFCVAFGSIEDSDEHFLVYKLGYIGKKTMVCDYDDILMPYDEETGEVFDTENIIGDELKPTAYESLKSAVDEFVDYCVDKGIITNF